MIAAVTGWALAILFVGVVITLFLTLAGMAFAVGGIAAGSIFARRAIRSWRKQINRPGLGHPSQPTIDLTASVMPARQK